MVDLGRIVSPLIRSLASKDFSHRKVREVVVSSSGINRQGARGTVRSRWRSCSRRWAVVGEGGEEGDGEGGDDDSKHLLRYLKNLGLSRNGPIGEMGRA
jgi:hypothetical protein